MYIMDSLARNCYLKIRLFLQLRQQKPATRRDLVSPTLVIKQKFLSARSSQQKITRPPRCPTGWRSSSAGRTPSASSPSTSWSRAASRRRCVTWCRLSSPSSRGILYRCCLESSLCLCCRFSSRGICCGRLRRAAVGGIWPKTTFCGRRSVGKRVLRMCRRGGACRGLREVRNHLGRYVGVVMNEIGCRGRCCKANMAAIHTFQITFQKNWYLLAFHFC